MGEFWEPGNKFGDPGTSPITTAALPPRDPWPRESRCTMLTSFSELAGLLIYMHYGSTTNMQECNYP